MEIRRRIAQLGYLVGNTPLLAIDLSFDGEPRVLYVKAGNLNMTGSIKDRMALHIVRQAYARGVLRPGAVIVEATSGNTGISFAGVGRALGHPVAIFMPDWMSRERIDLLCSLGAEIHLVTKEEGGFVGSIRMAEEYARGIDDAFLPRQFSNADNIEAHATTTGPEIWWQLRFRALKPAAFVAGVGTGGTIMGTGSSCAGCTRPSGFTLSSPPTRRRFRPGTRWASTGSRGSPTSSSRRSSTSLRSIPSWPSTTGMRSSWPRNWRASSESAWTSRRAPTWLRR